MKTSQVINPIVLMRKKGLSGPFMQNIGDGKMIHAPGIGATGVPAHVIKKLPLFDSVTGKVGGSGLLGWYNTRTSINSTFVNSDGNIERVPANTLVYEGARIVRNFITSSEVPGNWDFIGVTYAGVVDGPSTQGREVTAYRFEGVDTTADRVDIPAGVSAAKAVTQRPAVSVWLRGNGTIKLGYVIASVVSSEVTITLTNTWQRFFHTDAQAMPGTANNLHLRVIRRDGNTATWFELGGPQFEFLENKSVQNAPGEYEPAGVGLGNQLYNLLNEDVLDGVNWQGHGNNTVEYDPVEDAIKVTYVDVHLGAFGYLREQASPPALLDTVLTIGHRYICEADVKCISTGMNLSVKPIGAQVISKTITTSSEYTRLSVVFTADSTTGIRFEQNSMTTGEVCWLKNISIRRASPGYGIYERDRSNVSVTGNVVTESPGALLPSTPLLRHAPAATNYFLNSDIPVTQTVTGIPVGNVVVSMSGAGSITLSGDATGVVTAGNPITYLGTGAGLTCTLSGSVIAVQVEQGTTPTPFIPSAAAAASRLTDSILHLYTTGVFNINEGTAYLKVSFNKDTDAIGSGYRFFSTIQATSTGWVIYPSNSRVYSSNLTTFSDRTFANVVAGGELEIIVRWSVSGDIRVIGANPNGAGWTWDATPSTFNGFAADLLRIMDGAPVVAFIHDLEVLDMYLSEDDAEVRWS